MTDWPLGAEDPVAGTSPGAVVFPDQTIVCVDCGSPARLLTTWDDERPPRPGDLAVYRCTECLDRWDVIVPGLDGELDPTDDA